MIQEWNVSIRSLPLAVPYQRFSPFVAWVDLEIDW